MSEGIEKVSSSSNSVNDDIESLDNHGTTGAEGSKMQNQEAMEAEMPQGEPVVEIRREAANIIDVPDGGYGWFVVLAIFLFNFSTWGANSAYAIYLAHYLNYDVFHGATSVDYGAIGGLTFGSGLLFGPVINLITGILGLHITIGIGIVLQFVALMLASYSTKLWELYMTQGVMLGIGLATIAIPNIAVLPQWFRRRRSLAIGISASGSGCGGICFGLGMQHIIEIRSYEWALRAEAIICIVCSGVALALIRTRAKEIKAEFKFIDKLCLRNFGVLVLALWLIWTILGYVVLLYNLSDFTISLGYTSYQGSIVSTMVSVGAMVVRPIVGRLCDLFGAVTVNVIVHLLVTIFTFAMWIPARNFATALIFALIAGSLMGSIWVVMATITTRIAGLQKMGACMSTAWTIVGIAGIVSPVIGVKLRETRSSGEVDPSQYLHPSLFVGFSYFGACLSLFVLRGWLIARDEILMEIEKEDEEAGEDTGAELFITVPPLRAARCCLKLKGLKKV
ncbi:hypothetical protein PACTADRAFT_50876 [Pachysolen tannophilus NRRL Y-2460]|uniref:Major facilitator superfamily (MFS) profile domain-containing protein n=1 Tax=Pachysolen tannophilus NRRL Y-2460 TaxID=669874 RepID=A0A1E4TTG8_PACTA|nr:hypothetical protein PACTADRAFT_50876 [Pachysolen tannophilus NRRL Y-2460]